MRIKQRIKDFVDFETITPNNELMCGFSKKVLKILLRKLWCRFVFNRPPYVLKLPPKIPKDLPYWNRSLCRDFDICFSYESDLDKYWREFLRLHIRYVKGATIFREKNYQDAYYKVAKKFGKDLKLAVLKADEEVIGVLFGIEVGDTFYFLNIGYVPFNKYSIGVLLPYYCMTVCRLKYFDFGAGYSQYKIDFGARAIWWRGFQRNKIERLACQELFR